MFGITKNKTAKPVHFTRLLSGQFPVQVIMPEDIYQEYQILQRLLAWQDSFREFHFYLPAYSYPFFVAVTSFKNSVFSNYEDFTVPSGEGVILNLSNLSSVRKALLKSESTLVAALDDYANLKFDPPETEPLKLLSRFAGFFRLPWSLQELSFSFQDRDFQRARYNFFQNKFLNFVLHLEKTETDRIRNLIVSCKQNFPVNIYLTGNTLKKHDFINLKNLAGFNLLDLYSLAREATLFITDQLNLIRLFHSLNVTQLLLSHDHPKQETIVVDPYNLSELKTVIPRLIKTELDAM